MNEESLFCVLIFLSTPCTFFSPNKRHKISRKIEGEVRTPCTLFLFLSFFFNQPNSIKSREKRLKGNSELLQEVFLFQKDGLNYYLVEANLKILRFDRQFNNRGVDLGSLNPSIFLLF